MHDERSMTRRNFSKTIAAGVGGLAGLQSLREASAGSKNRKLPVGLQLYTLRDLMQKDFSGTVSQVAKIGYDAVEFAGYGGKSAKEIKKLLDDNGLICAGTHEGYGNLGDRLSATIDFNAAIGCPNIVCPAMPGEMRDKGAAGYRAFGESMNAIAEKVKAAGMSFAYHNHNFEFAQENGRTLFDSLLAASDPGLVKLEVDVYWVKRAGVDPVVFIRQNADRVSMIHMKDMADDDEQSFAPVGTGVLDLKSVVSASRSIGVAWFVVEQDRTKRPPLEAVEISLRNMRILLGA